MALYELRLYRIRDGQMPAWLDLMEGAGVPEFDLHIHDLQEAMGHLAAAGKDILRIDRERHRDPYRRSI